MIIKQWWRQEDDQHRGVFEIKNRLKSSRDDRLSRWKRYLSIFLNKGVSGFFPGDSISEEEAFKNLIGGEKRLALNPIENCGSALGARIASQRPRAQFLASTNGPNGWEIRKQAMGLEKFVAGEWYRNKLYRRAIACFFDGVIFGYGAMKVYPGKKRIKFERTPPWELDVDAAAAIVAEPRSLYQTRWVAAEVLMAEFPGDENESAIERATRKETSSSRPGTVTVTDLVEVVEAWHLPSSEDADDGKHIICIDGKTLSFDDWPYDRFPFAFFRWNEPIIGWFPQGLVEQHEPSQQQVNKILSRIQDALHLYANAKTYAEEGSIDAKKQRNVTGDVVFYRKGFKPPVVNMPASISSEVFSFVWQIFSKIFEGTGVSQLSAASVKPPGVESGKALRILDDKEQGRHALTNQAWDDFYMDTAELTVISGKEMHASNGDYSTNFITKDRIEKVMWKDVDLDRDAYEIQIFPSSSLPYEPAGRYAMVDDMYQSGFVNKQQAMMLLKMPDLEQFTSLETAAAEDIDMQIHEMLMEGNAMHPEPFQDLQLGLAKMTSALLRSRQQGAPEDRQHLLLDWIEEAASLLEPKQPEEQIPAGMQPPHPQMMAPPPTAPVEPSLPIQG